MDPVVVVGSGPSGLHFAQSALEKGRRVVMLDVGRRRLPHVLPNRSFRQLKDRHDDPVEYFLGRDYESLILPGHQGEYYGFPPSKRYVFQSVDNFQVTASGFAPLASFAAGGLAEAWTGGCYPFNDAELREFPFAFSDLEPYYARVAQRIGISGANDDLTQFFPWHDHVEQPLELDEHSQLLLDRYAANKTQLNDRWSCFLGRSRVAVLTKEREDRVSCAKLGRCLWGCPTDSLYTPSVTLNHCLQQDNFQYLDGLHVRRFETNSTGTVQRVVAVDIQSGMEQRIDVGMLVLAAGTMCSSKIYLDSVFHETGSCIQLPGLMDNRQVLMPFLNLRLLGKPYDPDTYQYHQVAIGLAGDDRTDYVHGLVTTLKTALIHPIVQSMPLSLGTSMAMFRNLHAALGLVNINFSDCRRAENHVTIQPCRDGPSKLVIRYASDPDEALKIRETTATFRKILWRLGCIAPSSMTHIRPMGASVHYCGTLPMNGSSHDHATDQDCRSTRFNNLYFVDGSTFPALPAKNLTFTLMANAARVADIAL